ncbi:hypothetical protein EDC28_10448 [Gallaecimonas pentaromativorans]|uniref:Lipoprotein n=1 Tax=Gallaecimonas pentaromativorans TaxID=584787 RepID=A0A3N1PKI0_9GAMM|nr:hypothetical protein EDC28_10448 [Gallaecimonas pentaromativorans]
MKKWAFLMALGLGACTSVPPEGVDARMHQWQGYSIGLDAAHALGGQLVNLLAVLAVGHDDRPALFQKAVNQVQPDALGGAGNKHGIGRHLAFSTVKVKLGSHTTCLAVLDHLMPSLLYSRCPLLLSR